MKQTNTKQNNKAKLYTHAEHNNNTTTHTCNNNNNKHTTTHNIY